MSANNRILPRPLFLFGYALLALIIVFELVVAWLALHPNVPEDYRAYYLDHTTTCLNQPVTGAYELGQTVSMLPDGREAAKTIKVCGLEGPVGDGTHVLGERARLRFNFAREADSLILSLRMVAVDKSPEAQPVKVLINGTQVDELQVAKGEPQDFRVVIPADVVKAADGKIDLFLDFPAAIKMDPNDSNTRKRSVRIYSVKLDAGA
jgi:hypothetical protein